MATKDILIYESGSGGEMEILNSDLVLTETIFQTIYLALFGGNIESNTADNVPKSVERLDWWGNELLNPNESSKWFNSDTERILTNVTINSQGRQLIEQAVKNDLEFLADVIEVTIDVSITSIDTVKISIFISEFENQTNRQLEMVWNNAKNELIIDRII
jgi:phage gp46-like protein